MTKKSDSARGNTALLLKKLRQKKAAENAGQKPDTAPSSSMATEAIEAIEPCDRSAPLALSFGQERLWLLDQLSDGSAAFNMPFSMRLEGQLNRTALLRAIAVLVERHESLRTTFDAVEGVPFQRIHPPSFIVPREVDLRDLPADQRRQRADEIIAADTTAPFDLASGPLYRVALLQLDDEHHILHQNIHHVVSDGWSSGVLSRELRQLLEAFSAGQESPLQPPRLQYADFAAWQRQRLQGEYLEKQLAFWRDKLGGAVPTLDLPTDRPRPAVSGDQGDYLEGSLPEALKARLDSLSQSHGASLFMTLLAAFKVLMYRYTAQEDILVGAPSAGRQRLETEDLVGFFLNTLVLRTQLEAGLPFTEALRRTRNGVLGATQHQDVPFEKLLEELQPERHLSQSPFFQVMFNMANIPDLRFELPGLAVEVLETAEIGSKFDLTLYAYEIPGQGLRLDLSFDPDLFDRARMVHLLDQYQHLLSQIAEHPDTAIDRYSLVTERARQLLPNPRAELSNQWRGTIAEGMARHAADRPEHPAVIDAQGTVTFGQLERRSQILAAQLLRGGLEKGDVVAVWAHRSAPLVEALMAIAKAGGAFTMLDPAYPTPRLLDYVELSEPRAMIQMTEAGPVPADVHSALGLDTGRCLELGPVGAESLVSGASDAAADRVPADLHSVPADLPSGLDWPEIGPDDLAYVAFTSGSTGKPKAILGRHSPLTHFLPWLQQTFAFDHHDRHSLLSALSHDPLHRDVFMPLWYGATICIPEPEKLGEPGYLAAWSAEQQITVLNMVPAMLQMLTHGAGEADETANPSQQLTALRHVFTVGDVLTRHDVTALYAMAPKAVCVNLYGSTETQRSVSYLILDRELELDPQSELGTGGLQKAALPLGHGIEGVQLLVLGTDLLQAGVGEVGEIYVRSHHLSRGYVDAELTAERFLANPQGTLPSDRLYRTGDLGRYLPDGKVEFLGRADHQVKIRGFRIELQEIEVSLDRHPAIAECAVSVVESGSGDKRLAAYLVLSKDASQEASPNIDGPSPTELRAFLADTLPDYMVPSAFVVLDALPLTRTGKLDRRALPTPDADAEAAAEFRPPETAIEQQLADLWQDLLGREQVGLDDDFFALGGHSLLATQLLARVRSTLGSQLPLRTLFEHPTLAGLAGAVAGSSDTAAGDAAASAAIEPQPRTVEQTFPLSFAQQRMWLLDQLEPASPAYVLPGALRLRGELDLEALERVFDELTARHETLRTRFVEIDGEPRQKIDPFTPHSLVVVDLTAEEQPVERAIELATEESRTGFDLASDLSDDPASAPLMRYRILKLASNDHVLLLSMHHIISDGWSIGVLVQEFGTLYRDFTADKAASTLPPLTVQYADFATWQRQTFDAEETDRQVAFWRQQLADVPARLELPTDHARPSVQSLAGALERFDLDADLVRRLEKISQQRGATLFMTLLATFQLMLGRLAGQNDVVVGSPIANRGRDELEGLIGFFVNTLALRTDLSGNPSFEELLGRVRSTALAAYEHQDLPFEKLVAELDIERDLSHSPVFQAAFALQNAPMSELDLGGLQLDNLEFDQNVAKFDLTMALQPEDDGLWGRLEYSTALFDRATAQRWIAIYRRLLEHIAEHPEARLSDLSLASGDDQQLLDQINDNATELPTAGLGDLFLQRAAERPNAIAVSYGLADGSDESLTWKQLEDASTRLAGQLLTRGIGPGDFVGLCAERGTAMITAMVGVVRCGAAFVYLDPTFPADRLAYLIEDAAMSCVLTAGEAALALAEVAAEASVDHLDIAELISSNGPLPTVPTGLADAQSTAFVIYTSGSTGRPKGVLIPHRGIVRLVLRTNYLDMGPDDVFSQTSNPAFDASSFEIWAALLNGGRLEGISKDELLSPDALHRRLHRSGVTIAFFTTALLHEVAHEHPQTLAGLRAVHFGGERCEPSRVREALAGGAQQLQHFYGPSECSTYASYFDVTAVPEDAASIPIGKPVANTVVRIVDPYGQQVPIGGVGELLLGGPGLAVGYHRRPALTAAAFVPDPSSEMPGERVYRTGDLVRLLPSGDLDFVGRADHQVKIRGFRIELGEIQTRLSSHPAIRDSLVVARDQSGELRLVAYLIPSNDPTPNSEELRQFLATDLPDFMLPSAFVTLDAFPMSATGMKIDHKALPAPLDFATQAAYVPPRNGTEELLAQLYAEVLSLSRLISADADFFALGGHSLLATRLVSRLRDVFDIEMPLTTLFSHATVRQLAEQVDAASRDRSQLAPQAPLVALSRDDDQPLPLSFAQQRLWFLELMEPGMTTYLMTGALRLTGSLDTEALAATFTAIVERHETLRTRFVDSNGEPIQVIDPPRRHQLEFRDLTSLPADQRLPTAIEAAASAAATPFDLTRGELFRTPLLKLDEQDHVLILSMHHIISDGWSVGVMVRELRTLYRALVDDPQAIAANVLPPLTVQYADFARWQQTWLSGDELRRQLDFWRQQLTDTPPLLELSTDKPRPTVQSQRGTTAYFTLPAELVHSLEAVSRQHSSTLFMTLMAGFQALLGSLSGQQDVTIGTPIAGRRHSAVEGMIGFFVNMLPIRGDLSGDPTFGELVRRVRQTVLGAYNHQDLPFEKLVAEMALDRDLSHSPIFQVAMGLNNAEQQNLQLGELEVSSLEFEHSAAKFDLTLMLEPDDDGSLAADIEYATDLFTAQTIERWMSLYRQLLERAAEAPQTQLSALTMAGEEDRALLARVNDTATDFPSEVSTSELFARQVRQRGDAIAVVYGDQQLSYDELSDRSRRLAHLLIQRGAGADSRIGLCVERSVEMVTGMLAILQAGGAYVPLDPDYPQDRLRAMVLDSEMRLAIVQQAFGAALAGLPCELLVLEAEHAALASKTPIAELPPALGGDAAAYIIFTSGSTGRPKGVVIPHRGLVRLVCNTNYHQFQTSDRIAQGSTANFDAATFEIWGPLLNGGRLVGVYKDDLLSPNRLRQHVERTGINVLFITTALFHQLAIETSDVLAGLRKVIYGGERCDPNVVRAAISHGSRNTVHAYGPSEVTTYATTMLVEEVPEGASSVPIGGPMSNTGMMVINHAGRPVTTGARGELALSGPGVAWGYWNQPAATAKAFVPHPESNVPGDRLYRTGDLVRLLPTGVVDYLGRIDHQVKVRGFRIELGEIEACLEQHPAVSQRIVLVQGQGAEARLAAYVTLADQGPSATAPELTAPELVEYLRQNLPDFAIPAVMVLEVMPLNVNGKIDRKALPPIDLSLFADAGRDLPPQGPTEELVAGLYTELLGGRCGRHSNFFELGGHSLLATQLMSRLRDIFGVEVPLRALFEGATVVSLAARVDQVRGDGDGVAAVPPIRPIQREAGQGQVLSFAQQRLWFIERMEPGNSAYLINSALRLRGQLDANVLTHTFNAIVHRHEALRTRFVDVDGRPRQLIEPPTDVPMRRTDLRHLPSSERFVAARQRTAEDINTPFDLERELPLRIELMTLADDDHVLLLTMHHIVSDGWSLGVMAQEMTAYYGAFLADDNIDPEKVLPPLPVQYADYAHWQQEWLSGDELQRQLDYWRQQLAEAPQVLNLPTDRPRPNTQSLQGATTRFRLDAPLTAALDQLSKDSGTTLFMTLMAAFQALLGRLGGTNEVVIGSPIANRSRTEIEGLIGFFVNSLVIRTDLSGDPTFTDLVRRVREVLLGAYAHQDLPFEKLVAEMVTERDLSRAPIFQVAFAFNNSPTSELVLGDLEVDSVELEYSSAKYDLTVLLSRDEDDCLRGLVEFATDLFDVATIDRMMKMFGTLLRDVTLDPSLRLSQYRLTPESDLAQLAAINDNATAFPSEESLGELFLAVARQQPEDVALCFGNRELTWAALEERSCRLANYLISRGFGPGDFIGLALARDIELIVAIAGVALSGAAYVPFDSSFPADRLAMLLEDADVRFVFSDQSTQPVMQQQGVEQLLLDRDWSVIADCPATAPAPRAVGGSTIYVIFTSGATGRPKGVLTPHRGVARLLLETQYMGLHRGNTLTQLCNPAYDASTSEIWGCLLTGARLVGLSKDELLSPAALRQKLNQHGVDTVILPAALMRQFAVDQAETFAGITLAFGGEPSDPSHLRLLRDAGVTGLVNSYGPTEATSVATAFDAIDLADDATNVPIGTPISNTDAWVLDAYGQPVPLGVVGELHLGGPGLALGYLHRPALTAGAFIPHSFSDQPGERLYRTGDLTRWLPSGQLEFLGRIDHQVKIRGFRIELGEIEAVLAQHPAIQDAQVLARQEESGDQRLIGYLVIEPNGELPSRTELRDHLKQHLPEFMLPAVFVPLDEFPLDATGSKVDRKALAALTPIELIEGNTEDQLVPAQGPTEELVAELFAELLNSRCGRHGDFFELGGHSLLATQLVSRVRNVFAVELPLRDLFEASKVFEVASRIDALLRGGKQRPLPAIDTQRTTDLMVLSFAQQRLWFIERMEPGKSAYHIDTALLLQGELDAEALAQTFSAIVARHETLRTRFVEIEGKPRQQIDPASEITMSRVDLSHLPADDRLEAARQQAAAAANRPFDLAHDWPMRLQLMHLADDQHVLSLCMHHIASDGWSIGVLVHEMTTLYEQWVSDPQADPQALLPALPVQYADFAAWQRGWLQDDELERQLGYWRNQLRDTPALLELPTDRPRPPIQSMRGATAHYQLDGELVTALDQLSKEAGVTLFMTLMAAYQTLLGGLSGSLDVVVGTPIANRNRSEVEGLIGFFVNTLAIRTDLSANPTFLELCQRVREVLLGAYAHQDLPFEKLIAEVGIERDPSHAPVFQAALTLNNVPDTDLRLGDVSIETLRYAHQTATNDLTFLLSSNDDHGLYLLVEYCTDLFDVSTIDRFVGMYRSLLEQVVAAPDMRLADVALTSSTDIELLAQVNNTAVEFPAEASIPELFARQAARHQQDVAVVYGDASITYGELVKRSRQLALLLRQRGARDGALIGLCVERSLDMVVGMLAILEAGGAYVPLDPSYPMDRLASMVEDTAMPLAIVQAALLDQIAELPCPKLVLEHEQAALEAIQAAADAPLPEVGAVLGGDAAAYVIFTSGSTGKPKGVVIPHRAVVRLIWETDYHDFLPTDRIAQASNANFDAATFEIWGALLNGARLVGVNKDALLSPPLFREQVARDGINTMFITTSLFHLLALDAPDALAGMRTVLFGGERCDPSIVRQAVASGLRNLKNIYGPTECTTFATHWPITHVDDDARSVAIGKPIANTGIQILDRHGRTVPAGVRGELAISGPGLAWGYWQRPALTASAFIPDATAARPGERLYRTGDLVRLLPTSAIDFLGRIDHQVKIRGFRIELGEIEAHLERHPAVRERIVQVQGTGADARLAAYVVLEEEAQAGVDGGGGLQSFLEQHLPPFSVPAVMVLETMPLNENGKIDRRALPPIDLVEIGGDEDSMPPQGPTEELVVELFEDLLGSRCGRHGDFFELGGHSLLATQLASRLRDVFGVELPLRDLFEAPTVARLASRIDALLRGDDSNFLTAISTQRSEELMPLSFAQQRLWFIERFEPGKAAYHIDTALLLRGQLDTHALAQTFNAIVARHETFRTRFIELEGEGRQVIDPPADVTIEQADLSHLPDDERLEAARQQAAATVSRPFDLSQDWPLRLQLIRLSDEQHVLALCMHHIASDGWSIGILVREMTILYEHLVSDPQADPQALLPALPLQYADFAAWQRGWLQGDVLERQLDYWRTQLRGAPALLELPTDHPRPPSQSMRGATALHQIDSELVTALDQLSKEAGVTLFMTLMAAYQTLLAGLAGSRDIVVGTPIANRNRSEIEGLIGFFVNTLAIRTDLSADPTFLELCQRVREVLLGAYAHQDLPFEKLIAEIGIERDPSHAPVFQTVLALNNVPDTDLRLGDVSIESLRYDHQTATNDLTVLLSRTEDQGLYVMVGYSTDLFDVSSIDRMMAMFRSLLRDITLDPSRRLSQYRLTPEGDRARMAAINDNATAYPGQASLGELFLAVARQQPDDVAVCFGDRQLTWAELEERACRLANHLISRGFGPGDFIGLALARDIELIVAIAGVALSGAAYAPLDSSFPADRLAMLLEDANVSFVFSDQSTHEALEQQGIEQLLLDRDWPQIAGSPATAPAPRADGGSAIYVIFTSGSTGRPKGVLIPHRGVARMLLESRYIGLHRGNTLAQLCNPAFDASTVEIWGCLLTGARLVGLSRDDLLSPSALHQRLSSQGVDTMIIPTALMNQFAADNAEIFAGIKLVFGGEACDPFHLRLLRDAGVGGLVNSYGPTETTAVATACEITELADDASSVSIGQPINNTDAWVLDAHGRSLPLGVAGELHVGGPGLAFGYLHRPALTAAVFVPHPFSEQPGERLYRTGDLTRWLPSDQLEFLGRIDHQVKIRGFRIELGEIEALLVQHPAIQDARVLPRKEDSGDHRLIAYLIAESQHDLPSRAELRHHLSQHLPDFMLPAVFVPLAELPLSATGSKVDRKALAALPLPEEETSQEADGRTAATTPVETRLAEIWAEVLGLEQVFLEDRFFEIGGHSLLAVKVFARLRQELGVDLPIRSLFDARDLRDFAARVTEAVEDDGNRSEVISRYDDDGPFPLTFGQERVWLLNRLAPEDVSYNMPLALRLLGELDVDQLQTALREVVRRHESLRTIFVQQQGLPYQVVQPVGDFAASMIDISHLEGEAREQELEELLEADAMQIFDLATGPVYRALLIRVDDQEHVLAQNLHHIVGDGWSLGVLFRELANVLLELKQGGDGSALPLPAIRYSDYALWQKEHLQGDRLKQLVGYWHRKLGGLPPRLELPTDRPRPARAGGRGRHLHTTLDSQLVSRCDAVCQNHSASMFMLLLAGFKVLLHRLSGQDDIVVGSPNAGRQRLETESVIGFFLNTLVLRTQLSPQDSFDDVVTSVRQTVIDASQHQDVPFEKLLDELQPERHINQPPLFQVMFNMTDLPDMEMELPGLRVENFATPDIGSKFDLTIYGHRDDDQVKLSMVYDPDLFDRARMQEFLRQLRQVLAQATASPASPIAELTLATTAATTTAASTAASRTIAEVLPDPTAPLPNEWRGPITSALDRHAADRPDHVAVSDLAGDVTYHQLARRVHGLSHQLVDGGLERGDVVAIWAHRSAAVVTALFSALEAGGAFMMLDPQYPTGRLVDYIRIAQPKALLRMTAAGDVPEEVQTALNEVGAGNEILVAPADASTPDSTSLPEAAVGPDVELGPDDSSYIAFTSGSTGMPKAIVGRHGPLTHFLPWLTSEFGLDGKDRHSLLSALSHDPLHRDVLMPIYYGATLVIPDPEQLVAPGYLVRWIEQQQLTVLNLVPAMLTMLNQSASDVESLTSVRRVFTVGEVLTRQEVNRLYELAPNATCVNYFGSTETSRAVSYVVVPRQPGDDESALGTGGLDKAALPLGRGLRGVQMLVLDSKQRLSGIGEVGEIHVRSPHLAAGYLDSQLSAERFITNPFTGDPADRLYRTGDLGRYLPNGDVEFAGRADQQVKIRGFRIELQEIEVVLERHPDIAECAVIVHGDDNQRRLAAYLVLRPHAEELDPRQLRTFLLATLPDYMVPATFMLLDTMPLTRTGKLDRRALPEPAARGDLGERDRTPPRNDNEREMATIWQRWLELEEVGIHDNFFELGGHSLLATQVLANLRDTFAIEVPLRTFFEQPTIAELAAELTKKQSEEIGEEALAGLLADVEGMSDEELELLLAEDEET